MSAATINRVLAPERKRMEIKGKSTTKPGSLRKKDIAIRLGTQWDESKPGYMETDLVAHCGETTAGFYANTLNMTDIFSGWTEPIAIVTKAQTHTLCGIKTIRGQLPFSLLGIDADNGGEFINEMLYQYCLKENLKFTRSRPYRKNDGCHVEQKNWSVVRKHMGYARYEGQEVVDLMNQYYALLRLFNNYFLPSAKLIAKSRHESTVAKCYDNPQTPCQRLLQSDSLTPEQKALLAQTRTSLDPFAFKRDMMLLREQIEALALPNARPLPDGAATSSLTVSLTPAQSQF